MNIQKLKKVQEQKYMLRMREEIKPRKEPAWYTNQASSATNSKLENIVNIEFKHYKYDFIISGLFGLGYCLSHIVLILNFYRWNCHLHMFSY